MYEVEKGIPIAASRKKETKYPFTMMDIGDSFFVPESEASRNSISISATRMGRRIGVKVTVRKIDGGIRVWRVA